MAEDNGTNPAPAAEAEAEGQPAAVPASERIMGLFGLAVAVAIGVIALDLASGGAVARLVGQWFPAGEADSDG